MLNDQRMISNQPEENDAECRFEMVYSNKQKVELQAIAEGMTAL